MCLGLSADLRFSLLSCFLSPFCSERFGNCKEIQSLNLSLLRPFQLNLNGARVREQGWDGGMAPQRGIWGERSTVPVSFPLAFVMPAPKPPCASPWANDARSPEPLDHWREPILCQNASETPRGRQKKNILKYEISDHCSQNKVSPPGQTVIYSNAKCYKNQI